LQSGKLLLQFLHGSSRHFDSIRHIEGKVRQLFGSRKPSDISYDPKLRPKDSTEMDQRVQSFIECKEQWHMLKQRARINSGLSGQSNNDDAYMSSLSNDDGLPVLTRCNPLSGQIRLAIQSLINRLPDCYVPMSPIAHSPRVSQPKPEYSLLDSTEWDRAHKDYGVTDLPSSSSVESFSSSGYGGSSASAIDRKRARNRENQRLHRTFSVIHASNLEF
jgi:hypothetical protein